MDQELKINFEPLRIVLIVMTMMFLCSFNALLSLGIIGLVCTRLPVPFCIEYLGKPQVDIVLQNGASSDTRFPSVNMQDRMVVYKVYYRLKLVKRFLLSNIRNYLQHFCRPIMIMVMIMEIFFLEKFDVLNFQFTFRNFSKIIIKYNYKIYLVYF